MKTLTINVKLRLVFSITIFFMCFCGTAQTGYWKEEASQKASMGKTLQKLKVTDVKTFKLDKAIFLEALKPMSGTTKQSKQLYFPNSAGEMVSFVVTEKSIMAPELAAKFPKIKSYVGESLDEPGSKLRFSFSHKGMQAMVSYVGDKSPMFIQKATDNDDTYVVYDRKSVVAKDFICSTQAAIEKEVVNITGKLTNDQMLRKFRLAVSATGEYTEYHGGSVADAMAAINATVTRINEVFERDLAVTLELVASNDAAIFTDSDADPYNSNLGPEAQSTLSFIIGPANYDIGHLFHRAADTGDAGFIGGVCFDNQKGSAFAASTNPEGDVFDLDFVAHEMGHQLGANHTWSFRSEGTLVQVEPASGNTIMGYAGIAAGNNVQSNGDDYFHYYSILQIADNLETISCPELISLTNTPPVITPLENYVIPIATAFVLDGVATDADVSDVLTHTWEQIDNGVVVTATFGPENPSGANFKSIPPRINTERYFPNLARIVQGALTQTNPGLGAAWETVSTIPREFNFAFTVRDNAISGGQVSSELVSIDVTDSAGPFLVSSQAANESYETGSVQEITWDVAGTDVAPVNAKNVDILLSTDGGLTFPVILAEDVLNDGEHSVLLPGTASSNARIMVKASDNIFLAVNSTSFSIAATEVVLNFDRLDYQVCALDNLVVPFTYETYLGFNETVTFSASGIPAGLGVAFSPVTATTNNTAVNLTFSNTSAVVPGDYPITIIATSASIRKQVALNLSLNNTVFSDVTLVAPLDETVDVGLSQILEWDVAPNTANYDIEIATDMAFTSIQESATTFSNTYIPTNLTAETTYFWRIKPVNNCGEGSFSDPFSFTTIQINCKNTTARSLPLEISSAGTPIVRSKIVFVEDLKITDLDVNLNITHSFLEDLLIRLISPAGTAVILTSNSCGNLRDINATFDDDGTSFVCNGTPPALRGTIKPLGALSSFNGESLFGEWTLEVIDTQPADGGMINSFSLDVCVEGEFRLDADNDGVFDDGDDLCLGTLAGVEVNTDGCPIYRFAQDNFQIEINSEACRENNDGTLKIDAQDTAIAYAVTVMGIGVNETADFSTIYELGNLAAGEYDVCITGTLGAINYEELCLKVVITEPDVLNITSKVSEDGKQVLVRLSGSAFYNVELNGILRQVEATETLLDLKEGLNTLKVSTNLPCQGIYEEEIFNFLEPVLYPNPVVDIAKIYVDNGIQNMPISIYTLNGSYVSSKNYNVNQNEIELDLSTLPSGFYIIQLNGKGIQKTFKVLKK